MTYARKVAVGYAFKNSFEGVDSEVTEVEVMILEAMQAQREAGAKALEDACFILKNFDTLTAKPQLQQAILNAEVEHGTTA